MTGSVRGVIEHLQATAQELLDEHWEDPDSASESGMHGTLCGECEYEWPCEVNRAASVLVEGLANLQRQVAAVEDALGRAVCHADDAEYLGACITAAMAALIPDAVSSSQPPEDACQHENETPVVLAGTDGWHCPDCGAYR